MIRFLALATVLLWASAVAAADLPPLSRLKAAYDACWRHVAVPVAVQPSGAWVYREPWRARCEAIDAAYTARTERDRDDIINEVARQIGWHP